MRYDNDSLINIIQTFLIFPRQVSEYSFRNILYVIEPVADIIIINLVKTLLYCNYGFL